MHIRCMNLSSDKGATAMLDTESFLERIKPRNTHSKNNDHFEENEKKKKKPIEDATIDYQYKRM